MYVCIYIWTGHYLIIVNIDFINRINETKDISRDVKSLYTSIPNHEGIEAVKSALNSVSQKPIATKVIIKLLFLTL